MEQKKIAVGLLAIISLSGCFNNNTSNSQTSYTSNSNSTINESSINENLSSLTSNDETENKKAIVVYFSASNNTRKVATYIANKISAPLFELEPVTPYTSPDLNYSNSNSRVVNEHNDENRHVELKNVTFEGFLEADYIFLGAPVWWQELSWVVDDFVKLNDFSNKTIIPFATSASSNYTTTKLQSYTTNANWMTPKRFSSSVSENTVTSWIDELNISL